MPLPIRPHPSTPTRPVSVMSRSDDLERLANLVGDAPEGARSGPGGELLRSDIPALQGVEHLLEADLETLVVVAVAARHPQRRRPRRDHRHGCPRAMAPSTGAIPPSAAPNTTSPVALQSRCRRCPRTSAMRRT